MVASMMRRPLSLTKIVKLSDTSNAMIINIFNEIDFSLNIIGSVSILGATSTKVLVALEGNAGNHWETGPVCRPKVPG